MNDGRLRKAWIGVKAPVARISPSEKTATGPIGSAEACGMKDPVTTNFSRLTVSLAGVEAAVGVWAKAAEAAIMGSAANAIRRPQPHHMRDVRVEFMRLLGCVCGNWTENIPVAAAI